MPKLDDYLRIGVDSLKVEGRGKSEYYAAIVARAYRMAIDDYYADPENWNAADYMDELETVGNRGYTLAFHKGRLTNLAHGYEQTQAIAQWEYAGVVTEVTEDAFHVEVKNKLEPGDVLEIVSPVARNTVLLRAYEYEIAATGESREVVHGSTRTVVRFPFALFEHEETEDLRMNFPPFTVVRKERALTEEQWARLQLDKTALAMEVKDTTGETAYKRRRDALVEAIEADANTRRFKTNRVGTEGCCGKGCNGCLIFWQDDSYAKAREILLQRKQGAMLTKAEASALRIPAAE